MPEHDIVTSSDVTDSSAGVSDVPAGDSIGETQPGLHQIFPDAYAELRAIARRQLALRAGGGTLSTTGLVHEAYLKLAAQERVRWKDHGHFMALAALAMRHVLVDRAKARLTQKRAGVQFLVTLDDAVIPADEQPEVMVQLSEAIDELGRMEPRLAQVVDCRFFLDMREEEIAEALGITVRTVQRDWAKARLWLRRAMARR
ncbi:MAG: ECF-type sigma factor [Gemmatimonadota bacterium]